MIPFTPADVNRWSSISDPATLMKTLHDLFGNRMAIGTSGQMTGEVIVDLCVQAGFKPRVYTVDTGRLFPETLALFEAVEKKYGITVERHGPDPAEVLAMVERDGEYLFFDSKEKQELCCRVRKVVPNERVLDTLDAWVTGLTADQSSSRRGLPRVDVIERPGKEGPRSILKVSPLADWPESKVWDYARAHDVPVNPLMKIVFPGGWRYESLGCVVCTTPIGPYEPRRAGRWRWLNQGGPKECGLHLPPPPPHA